MKNNKSVLFYVVLVLALIGCKPADDQSILDKNMELWANSNISSYKFTYNKSCFCLPEEDVITYVADGNVSGAFYKPSGDILTAEQLETVSTVEDFFAVIQDAITRNAASLQVTYHPKSGYPETISIDYDEQIADDEIIHIFSDFYVYQ